MAPRLLNIIGIGLITLAAITGILIISTVAFGYQYDKQNPPAGKAVSAFKDTARLYKDVRYCDTESAGREYDLYVPKERKGSAPLVIHVHGGSWRTGEDNNGIADHYAKALTERGIAFASVDYRLVDEAVYPAQNQDVDCAIVHLQKHARLYGVDGQNIIMMGDSAGGHLAALVGLDGSKDYVKAVVMLYGVSDLWKQINEGTDVNALHYLGDKAEFAAKKASPAHQALWDSPPFLLVHGTADVVVAPSQSSDFTEQLKQAGRTAEYVPIEGAGHGFAEEDSSAEAEARKKVIDFITQQFNS